MYTVNICVLTTVTMFPLLAHDELGTCRASLVSPQQSEHPCKDAMICLLTGAFVLDHLWQYLVGCPDGQMHT